VLVGLSLTASADHVVECSTTVHWIGASGRMTDDPREILPRLISAAAAPLKPPDPLHEGWARRLIVPAVRELVLTANRRRWAPEGTSPDVRRLVLRLRGLAERAARRRDRGALAAIDRALAFAASGHTAGEAMLVGRLVAMSDAQLLTQLSRLPAPSPRWDLVWPEIIGVIVFSPSHGSTA